MNVQQISFAVPAIVHDNLAKRAGTLNIRPAEYARRLFEAAYAARIADERGQEPADRALARAVREVFLLADCEPGDIAEALHLPVERVTRILDGWRQAAKNLAAGKAPTPQSVGSSLALGNALAARASDKSAAPTPPPARLKDGRAPPRDPRSERAWPAATIEQVRVLWAEGKSAKKIAVAIGKNAGAVEMFASKHRDICPKRRGG